MKLRELHKSLIYMCLIRIATIAFLLPQCMGVSWIPDTVSSSISTTTTVNSTTLTLRYSANGVIDSNEGGHFRVQLSARDQNSLSYNGITDCLAIGSSAAEVESAIQTTSLLTDITLPDSTVHRTSSSPTSPTKLFSVAVKRLYEDAFSTSSNTYIIQFENRTPLTSVEISVNTTGCINPRTVGLWSDGTKWDTGAVPSANDDVVIPFGSGIVVLTSDVTVSSFTQISGNLVGIDTSCPHGWSVSFRGQAAFKCYKLFSEPMTFEDADNFCNQQSGTLDAHLVQIADRQELLSSQRVCRGNRDSPAFTGGCWIGLLDKRGDGQFDWIEPKTVGAFVDGLPTPLFLDWRWNEPNNRTVSEGQVTAGERCTLVIPWQEDTLLLEQGSWNDVACSLKKPFVCQHYGESKQFSLTVSGTASVSGGQLTGAKLVFNSDSIIDDYQASMGAVLEIGAAGSDTTIGQLLTENGVILRINGNVNLVSSLPSGRSFIGEQYIRNISSDFVSSTSGTDSNLLMQSVVTISEGVIVGCSSSETIFNARLENQGIFQIQPNSNVFLLQGGLFSETTFNLLEDTSKVFLNGYSSKLSTYDAYELTISHRGEVIGEYYGSIAQERQNRHADYLEGVYRLSIASADGTEVYTTTCLPYNITAADMKYSLEDLPLVSRNGGVSVRRYGNGNSSRFLYGYTYRIELDSPSTNVYDLGPLSMSVHCYGSGECGCAETKVPLIDRTGRPQCPTSGKVSLVDENACVIPPIIGIQRISTLSYALTSGKGSITIGEGVHRLPPVSSVEIETLSGIGVVAADIIAWFSLRAIDEGTFIFAGKGWAGWDSSYLLYSPDDTFGKGFVERLDAAPAFSMTLDQFYLDGVGSVLMSCPNSTMKWSTGVLAGGIVGGRGTLSISGLISATGGTKSIRYALNLIIEPTATLEWLSGNIVLADGAYIYVEGRMTVNSINSPIAIGESHTLLSTSDPTIYSANSLFLQRAPGRLFHGYFDRTLPAELRGGFYRNPICGNQCLQTNYITFLGSSVLEIASESEVTFYLPLNLDGQSNLVIGSSVLLNLASGGVCGTKVIIDISSGTTLELSGGRMLMGATCTIRGQGELLVSAGQHDLGFSIDAHITISGGTMVWPLSRGPGSTITFNGGLLIDSVGELQIEPFSTTIVVNQEVHLKDSGLIQFPLLGISAQASPYDRQDAPDTSPRGNLTATGIMRWDGGTIRGKADFNALDILYLDGQVKNIRSLAKLVNRGHCEWGTGDIIIADNGGFLNLGSLQMLEGVEKFTANALYQGTEVPLENGGDVFALEYHSFDNDEGALDYTQYVDLRTRFVSRAPNGWSEDLQN